jgi:hypothetical protein
MLKYLTTIALLILSCGILAAPDPLSSYRDPSLPYTHYLDKSLKDAGTPYREARLYTGEGLAAATVWSSAVLQAQFEQMRDDRFISWSGHADFPRRITWLYPNDGCFARAGAANLWFKDHGVSVPSKVFAFGSLSLKTSNTPWGYASWWYHTAPIVEVDGTKYVLDPSVDPTKPLKLDEWLDLIGTPSKIKVAICAPGSYTPKDSCSNAVVGTYSVNHTKQYLSSEYNQLKKLNRDPTSELGDNPPW